MHLIQLVTTSCSMSDIWNDSCLLCMIQHRKADAEEHEYCYRQYTYSGCYIKEIDYSIMDIKTLFSSCSYYHLRGIMGCNWLHKTDTLFYVRLYHICTNDTRYYQSNKDEIKFFKCSLEPMDFIEIDIGECPYYTDHFSDKCPVCKMGDQESSSSQWDSGYGSD